MRTKYWVVLALAACSEQQPSDTMVEQQGVVIAQHTSDGNNPPGTAGFFFLSPFADPFVPSGTFDATFQSRLKLRIDNLSSCNDVGVPTTTHITFNTVQLYTATQQYRVNLNTNAISLVNGNCYRVIPLLDNEALGFRDVHVTSGAAAAGFKKWGPGTNQQVPWRIEDIDTDNDGVLNHTDNCPVDANAGQEDTDLDGIGDACDTVDTDGDGVIDSADNCPTVSNAGQEDGDTDGFGDACEDCDTDPNKQVAGICGCNVADDDTDTDGTADCNDGCALDPNKIAPGTCGCGVADDDTDSDGTADCNDGCALDPNKIAPGTCGCGVADTDSDSDGVADCIDNCPNDPNPGQEDTDLDGIGNACEAPAQHVSDGNNLPGTANFFFLPQLVDPFVTTGTFDATLKPRLRILVDNLSSCDDNAAVTTNHTTFNNVLVYAASEQYKVNTNVGNLGLITGNCYRIQPTLDGNILGFRDIHITSGTVAAGFRKWGPGSNQQIAFRITLVP